MAILLDGKDTAARLQEVIKGGVQNFTKDHGIQPRLAVIQVGNDPASSVYVRQKEKACDKLGILASTFNIEDHGIMTIEEIQRLIEKLNADQYVHGILLQLPLPEKIQFATRTLLNMISPAKDVDCLTDRNLGKLYATKRADALSLTPCTPAGIMFLMAKYSIELKSTNCVIVGRSPTVSKPLATMLLSNDATVTMCHTKTRNLCGHTKNADVLIVAAGHRDLITPDMVKNGAVVVDVGINRDENNKLHGDVHPDVMEVASHMTPVPGGVGPMTVTMLMQNTLTLARLATYR